ncbi:MAG: PAS domain S-box protein [bacterium]
MEDTDKTQTQPMPGGQRSQVRRYAWTLVTLWTIVISIFMVWSLHQNEQQLMDIARAEGRAYLNKDRALRFWAASHGGVYVPTDDRTPPNQYLSHIPDRDIEAPSGQLLTLMSPAHMIRQMYEQYSELCGVTGHITCLKPLWPENAPDEWEKRALESFQRGETEVAEFATIDGEQYLRLMHPVIAEKSCLKYYGHQGYQADDIIGGVSVAVPMAPLRAASRNHITGHIFAHLVLWLLGVLGMVVGAYHVSRRIAERDETERKFHQSVKRNEALLQAVSDLMFVLDRNGTYLDYRADREEDLAIPAAEIVGKNIRDTGFSDHQVKLILENIDRALTTGVTQTMEYELETPKGLSIWEARLAALDRDQVLCMVRNIANRKQAENETAKFKGIVDHAAYGVMIADLDGHITYVNDWWALMHGYSRDEIPGRHLSMFHNEEQMEEVTEIVRELQTAGSFSSQEIGHKRKDGTVIPTLMSGVMIRDEQDHPCYMAATVINITDRKRVEDALRVSERRFYDVAMSTADWIWEVDVNGRYTYASGKAEKSLGYSPEELIGKTPFDMMPDEEAERIGKIFATIVAEKKPIVDLENWNVAKDGRNICMLTNGVPVLDEDGELVGYRGVDKDITERKQAEQALNRTMSELKRFNQFAVGRELQVTELKEEINLLLTHAGREPKYRIVREEKADATSP